MNNSQQSKIPFGNYEIFHKLAVGGMAELYLAKQKALGSFGRTVVLKCILPQFADDPDFITMFFDEARIASHLNHPNIVQIYELGHFKDVYYIAMEYIRGPNFKLLKQLLSDNYPNPPFELISALIVQAAEGLHCAHTATDESGNNLGIVHRDVSPTNILLAQNGIVKIVDFGIAKANASIKEHKTQAGMIKGKYRYMSPEQILNKRIDHRSDIFSLGIVTYELSTGVQLFKRDSQLETFQAICQEPIPPPSKYIEGYPPELEKIVMKSLERDPNKRYQSCEEMGRELQNFLKSKEKQYTPLEISKELANILSDFSNLQKIGLGSSISKGDFIRFGVIPKEFYSEMEERTREESFSQITKGRSFSSSFISSETEPETRYLSNAQKSAISPKNTSLSNTPKSEISLRNTNYIHSYSSEDSFQNSDFPSKGSVDSSISGLELSSFNEYMALDNYKAQFKNYSGLNCIFIATIPDNLLYDYSILSGEQFPIEKMASYFGQVIKATRSALRIIGTKTFSDQVTIETEKIRVILREISEKYIVGIIVERNLPLGRARQYSSKILTLLKDNLPIRNST